MRIVADTNLLIASIFWNGAPYRIVQKTLSGSIEIFTSPEILNEVRKVLVEEFSLSEQEVDDITSGILTFAKVIDPLIQLDVVKRDPNDNHIIAAAITAKAEYIVTRDNDLLELKKYKSIKITTPDDFEKLTKGNNS